MARWVDQTVWVAGQNLFGLKHVTVSTWGNGPGQLAHKHFLLNPFCCNELMCSIMITKTKLLRHVLVQTWWSNSQSMSERFKPACASEASMVCGTIPTANRKTSVPFIFIHEKDERFGGNPRAEPFVPKSWFVSTSLIPAFRCLLGRRVMKNFTLRQTFTKMNLNYLSSEIKKPVSVTITV